MTLEVEEFLDNINEVLRFIQDEYGIDGNIKINPHQGIISSYYIAFDITFQVSDCILVKYKQEEFFDIITLKNISRTFRDLLRIESFTTLCDGTHIIYCQLLLYNSYSLQDINKKMSSFIQNIITNEIHKALSA